MTETTNYKQARDIMMFLYTHFKGEKRTHSEVLNQAKKFMRALDINESDKKYFSILSRAIDLYEIEVGIKTFNPFVIAKNKKSNLWVYKKKENIPHSYFDRYKMYLTNEGFAQKSIDNIEQTCEKILAYCANPECGYADKKLGLVVGDVQSGKTANYLALINMAYDYGYKIVVLLAGMTDSLRIQTQKRMDAGVIGAVSDSIGNVIEYCGVGLAAKDHFAIPFTNRENDFSDFIQRNLNATINDFKKPVVLVVKKNKKILESVMERLKTALQKYETNSLLVIDDEADNASISTAKPGNDPTAINRCIRSIFNSFPIASYVGFTATPFANIFINPDDVPENRDLFPSDFIVQLNAPDNYFGGRKVFSGSDVLPRPLRIIDENEDLFLPVIHDKDDHYWGLSESLKEAILVFLINNVVRTIRGDESKHRSMMINISRFNNMHLQIKEAVQDYINHLRNIIEQDAGFSTEMFIRNTDAKKIFDIFNQDHFFDEIKTGNAEKHLPSITWENIQAGLYNEIKLFETIIINSRNTKKNRFDYEKHSDGARVIVIGGFVLSRGLTLEGLMVSYYSRNAMAYDTLLQMCRWFGYRPKYEDLCCVYLSQTNVDNFNAVLDAVEDLKDQFAEMDRRDKKPSDFGLMVKQSPETLETTMLITGRNKLRYTNEIVHHLHYGGVYADTSKLSKSSDVNKHNIAAFRTFYDSHNFSFINGRYMAQNVSKFDIADFVHELKIPYVNRKFDVQGLSEYIENSDIFFEWDVVIATGDSDSKFLDNPNLPCPTRSFHYEPDESYIRIGAGNNRVLEPGIFNAGLWITEDKKREILEGTNRKDLTALDYLKIREKPILVIYPIDLKINTRESQKVDEGKKNIKDAYDGLPLIGFAVGFPDKDSKVLFNYRMNKIKERELEKDMEVDTDEEDTDND